MMKKLSNLTLFILIALLLFPQITTYCDDDNKECNKKKVVYLTFDDGPTTSVTPKILDILKSENVKASFFVIGKSVDVHPEIVKRAYDEGHYIANHG